MAHPWGTEYDWTKPMQDLTTVPGFSEIAFLSAAGPAGCLVSTAEDNALFWHKLMSGQIINQASLLEMRKYKTISSTVGYGLGIFRYKNFNGTTIWCHGGTGFGFINENITDSITGVVITALTNQDSVDNNLLQTIVLKSLHRVTQKVPAAGVNEPVQLNTLGIYPNPAATNQSITLRFQDESQSECDVQIYDAAGKKVYSGHLSCTSGIAFIPVPGFKSGIYFIVAGSGNEHYSGKLLVEGY
jgi:hypothetical protein